MGFLDWLIMFGGIAGFIGTLTNSKTFYDTERLAPHIERHGERKVKTAIAVTYLVFAVIGAALLLLGPGQ